MKKENIRTKINELVESKWSVWFITALILLNSVTLGFETDPEVMRNCGTTLHVIDRAILILFTFELSLKIYGRRFQFLQSGWNIFDLIIVLVAWIPASGPLSILRALRILRVFRLFSVVPQMRKVVSALLHSIPGMLSVAFILGLIFYVSAVLSTTIFGHHSNADMQEWFGTISKSLYTLFQVMTLESWSMGIVRPTMQLFPHAWLFFVPFIIITSFAVLNLFIGIIVDAMQVAQVDTRDEDKEEIKEFTHGEIAEINVQLQVIQKELKEIRDTLAESKKNTDCSN